MVLATVKSDTTSNVTYEIRLSRNNRAYCTCPSWKYQHLPTALRTCKHLNRLAQAFVQKAD